MHLAGCQTSGWHGIVFFRMIGTSECMGVVIIVSRLCIPPSTALNTLYLLDDAQGQVEKRKKVHATKRAPIGAGKCGKAQENHAAVQARHIQIEIITSKATN